MYVKQLVKAVVEAYINWSLAEWEGSAAVCGKEDNEALVLDMDKLSGAVQHMFEWCYTNRTYHHALGVAFEAREAGQVDKILN